MPNFENVVEASIPNGKVVEISVDGLTIWSGLKRINYVSFGDSIAAGHRIDGDWETDYGWDAQYGVDGRTHTTLVPGCYTDIIGKELKSVYGDNRASVTSFARSGDKVSDLMTKLTHSRVQTAIKNADLITISIGANDVLHYALTNLESYLMSGDSSVIDGYVADSLAVLNDDSNANSYISLFKKLNEINPNAKYMFTTIYNPYKHLWLVEGSGPGSFFYPVLSNFPSIIVDVDRGVELMLQAAGLSNLLHNGDLAIYNVLEQRWVSLELNIDIGQYIKDRLLSTAIVQTLFKSVNSMGTHAEGYIDGNDRFIGLNPILRSKINSFQSVNPNFKLAETKKLFDLFPSRTESDNDVDYSDLVNVEFAREYDVAEMDWGALWRDSYGNATAYYTALANKHLSFKNGLPSTSPWDYVDFDMEGFAAEFVSDVISKVIEPNMDPHPKHQGHQVMKRSFGNIFGLAKYESNGGLYVGGDAVLYDRPLVAPAAIKANYKFGGWYTDAALQSVLNPFSDGFVDYDSDITLADLVSGNTIIAKTAKTTQLYAMWCDPDQIVLKNMCPIMDGAVGFTFNGNAGTFSGEASSEHTKYARRSLKMSIGSDCLEMYGISVNTYPLDASHVYYACVEAYQEAAVGNAEIYFPIAEPHMFNLPVQEAGKWNKYSAVCDRSSFGNGNYKFRLDFNNASTPLRAEIWYDGLMIIDLTEAFGAGKEPDKNWCDTNIPYFVGVTTVTRGLKNLLPKPSEWVLSNATVTNEVIEYQANANSTATYYMPRPIAGHKYYGRVMQKSPSGFSAPDSRFEYWLTDKTGKYAVFARMNTSTNGEWKMESSIQSFESVDETGNYRMRCFIYMGTDVSYRKEPMLIDLTAAFGAGNEPSKEWCDANIPYFVGMSPVGT